MADSIEYKNQFYNLRLMLLHYRNDLNILGITPAL
jgi:hypothetical protein